MSTETSPRRVAEVEFMNEATEEDIQELIRRLDDGNEFPGFTTEMDAGTLHIWAEE